MITNAHYVQHLHRIVVLVQPMEHINLFWMEAHVLTVLPVQLDIILNFQLISASHAIQVALLVKMKKITAPAVLI